MTLRGCRHWLRALWLAALVLLWARPAAAAESIVVWHAYRGEEEAALERALAEFSDAARERGEPVSISTLAIPYDAFSSKINAAVPLGDGPHLFIDSHERLGDYRNREVVAPVGDALEDGAFLPAALQAVTLDDEVFAVPLNLKSLALYVNTELADPPATFEAIVDASFANGVYPLAYEAMNPYAHAPLLHAFGGTMLRDDDTFGMVGPEAEASVAFAKSLLDGGVVPSDADGSAGDQPVPLGQSRLRDERAVACLGPRRRGPLRGGPAPAPSPDGQRARSVPDGRGGDAQSQGCCVQPRPGPCTAPGQRRRRARASAEGRASPPPAWMSRRATP